MKKFLILLISLFICASFTYAQYNPYYNPYSVAEYTANKISENEYIRELNNLRFDENAISENPEVYSNYLNYIQTQKDLNKKIKIYDVVGYSGLGLTVIGLIPLFKGLNCDYNDPNEETYYVTSSCLIGCGLIMTTICYIGELSINSKIIRNKEDFVFYLRTYNNGIGIITLF